MPSTSWAPTTWARDRRWTARWPRSLRPSTSCASWHSLRPALLQAGLGAALRDLASRAPVPVDVAATGDRYPPDVEAAAYFVACEGLTNAVKHAGAEHIQLQVARHDGSLVVSVADDGVGGAAVGRGSGLTGLSDRVAARGGNLSVDSVLGRGTRLTAELPCVS